METLFHYCTSESFRSIVTTRTLRLSSLTLSNDSLEGKMVAAALLRVAEADGLPKHHTSRLLSLVNGISDVMDGLGFCLSKEADQLGQWRGYADDGAGLSIGFSKSYLEAIGSQSKDGKIPGFGLSRVEYDTESHDSQVEPTYQKAKELIEKGALDNPGIRGLLDTRSDEEVEADRERISKLLSSMSLTMFTLITKLYLLKSPAFREEREWLLLSYRSKVGGDQCEFHSVRDRIIPFRSYDLKRLEAPAIPKVVLGPKHITPVSVIEELLAQSGFDDVEVVKSQSSYR